MSKPYAKPPPPYQLVAPASAVADHFGTDSIAGVPEIVGPNDLGLTIDGEGPAARRWGIEARYSHGAVRHTWTAKASKWDDPHWSLKARPSRPL